MEITNIVFESDSGYAVDENGNCYDSTGSFVITLTEENIKVIASGKKFGGMYWKPVNFSLENE